jgi:hypothetical protein
MRREVLFAVLLALPAGCTFLESRDGLVGSLAEDAGPDSTTGPTPSEAGAPTGGGTLDGGVDGAQAPLDGAPTPDGSPPPPTDGGPMESTDAAAGPVALYTSLTSPLGIALNGTDVCWVGGDTPRGLYCAPKAGGGPIQNLDQPADQSLLDGAFDLVVDATDVYWSNGPANQVVHKPLPGGTSVEFFTGDGRLAYLAMEGTQIYASDFSGAPDAGAGNIVVGPTTGVMSTVVYPLVPGASGVAVLNGTVYWGRSSPNALSFGPEAGNATTTNVDVGGAVTGIAVDSQQVAYLLVDNQKIMKVPYGTNQADLVYDVGTAFGVSDIAVDDTSIYWSEHDLGQIEQLAK